MSPVAEVIIPSSSQSEASPETFEQRYERFLNELKIRWPNLYSKITISFSIPDGWAPLVENLSNQLEALILQEPEVSRDQFFVDQVKEKFGFLRFYMSSATDEMNDFINEAEHASKHICQFCSAAGASTGTRGSWIITLCESCAKKKL